MYGNFLIFTVKRGFRLVALSSDFFGSVEYKSNKDPFIYFFDVRSPSRNEQCFFIYYLDVLMELFHDWLKHW